MEKKGFLRPFSRRMPSPAMVVACIALSVALGGTSYAAIRLPAGSVGTKQLKRGAVTGVKVKGNALGGVQINEARLAKVPSARRADTAGSATSAATAANATTADTADTATRAPVIRLDYQSTTVALPAAFGTATRGTVSCPAGLNVVGGGAKLAEPWNGVVDDSNPVGRTGWEATGSSETAQNMTVFVICAQAASTTP
jgi:hypothetical protein